MKQNEYYYKIKGLMIPSPAPQSIEKKINSYIDGIEVTTKRLEESLKEADIAEFKRQMQKVQDMLGSVYARRLEVDGDAILRIVENTGEIKSCRKLLLPFITKLHSLSIEMQKAQNLKGKAFECSDSEKYGESAQNLSVVNKLIDEGNYDKAKGFVSDMQNSSSVSAGDNVLELLSEALRAREYDKVSGLASAKQEEYMRIATKKGDKTKKILAVDDRPEVLNIVNAALADYYQVLAATDGDNALKIMQQHRVDLFILDIEMPGMDGFELTKRIRADKNYEATPIIFFTFDSSRERIKRSMELGISDFIVKPSYPETLLMQSAKYLM